MTMLVVLVGAQARAGAEGRTHSVLSSVTTAVVPGSSTEVVFSFPDTQGFGSIRIIRIRIQARPRWLGYQWPRPELCQDYQVVSGL